MILTNRIVTHEQGITLVDALVSFFRHHPPGTGGDHAIRRVAELWVQSDYEGAGAVLTRLLGSMKLLRIGIDHQLAKDTLDVWEDGAHRNEMAREYYRRVTGDSRDSTHNG